MMKKICFSFVLLFSLSFTFFGQSKSISLPSTYDRSSLSLILLDHHDSRVRNLFAKVEVPEKYFENKIVLKAITVSSAIPDAGSISNELNRQGIGTKIVAYCYARRDDGTMSADRFQERALYNATDADVLKAKATKLGMDVIRDYGDKIIGKSYAVVLDYTGLREINEGNSRGWYSDVKMYLYKVNFAEADQAKLYNELWIYPDDAPDVKANKKLAFDRMNIGMEFVSQVSAPVSAQDFKVPPPNYPTSLTQDQLLEVVLQAGLDKCLAKIEKIVEEIKVKTKLYRTKPPRAKIGKKEGLMVDQCYFAYEYVFRERSNELKAVRRSVVRAKIVNDNRSEATGSTELSTFYQVASGHLKPGFTLQQHNESGIGLYIGNESGNVGGLSARIEKRAIGLVQKPAVYIFLAGVYQQKQYSSMHDKYGHILYGQNVDFLRVELGAAKGMHFLKIFELSPYVSLGLETAKSKDWTNEAQFSGDLLRSMHFKVGANLSLNLRYNLQAVSGIGSYFFLTAMDGSGEIISGDQKISYDYFFPDRAWGESISTYIGLRFQF